MDVKCHLNEISRCGDMRNFNVLFIFRMSKKFTEEESH